MGVAYKQVLSNIHCHTSLLEVAAVSKAMPTSKVYLLETSLVDSAACCPSTLLHVKTVVYVQKILAEIISQTIGTS